ncbi:hypothetical protein [Pengzhenrongella phosphoraccumulans]|uniref:DUF7657 domain-containing protein n=1 Tax=Pengzhenrongella phosphoraccumulans TaxID=3114394 RepID=UPI00388E1A49
MNRLGARARSSMSGLRAILARIDGAPLSRQVLLGAGLYAAVLLVLVVTAINGTSSGMYYKEFFAGVDPRLIIGGPRGVRSDEWYVTTPLVIAQVQQGLPRISDVFPGGVDMSVMWDMPYREWSAIFRPHNWGFYVLPLDNAFALRWWLPLVALGVAAYAFLVTLWRRPIAALALSAAFAFSPFTQWWFGAGTFWPLTFAMTVCVAVVWCLRTPRAAVRWAVAALTAYVAVAAAVTLYTPFLIPCVLVAAAFSIGWVCSARELDWRDRLRRIVPVLVAGLGAGVVTGVFLASRAATVEAITSTVYPGDRSWLTGQSSAFPWESMYAGVFGLGLRAADVGGFVVNASEGSSFLLVGFFLIPSALWLVGSQWRRERFVDWTLIALLAVTALFAAFIYVPGWDAVAHLLWLDRTTLPRLVVGLGLVALLLLAVVVHRLQGREGRLAWWPMVVAVLFVVVNHAAVAVFLHRHAPWILAQFPWWPVLLAMFVIAVALYARGRATVPSVLVLVVALTMVAGVVPLYRGVLDLRTTGLGQAITAIEADAPGRWLALDDGNIIATVREAGVESYSGVQGFPSTQMWDAIDPDRSDAGSWNRYAHVNWTADKDAPEIELQFADVLMLRFDSCAPFAQGNVRYVVASEPVTQGCLAEVKVVPEEGATYRIYEVVR